VALLGGGAGDRPFGGDGLRAGFRRGLHGFVARGLLDLLLDRPLEVGRGPLELAEAPSELLAELGSFFGPKIRRARAKMKISSGIPRLPIATGSSAEPGTESSEPPRGTSRSGHAACYRPARRPP